MTALIPPMTKSRNFIAFVFFTSSSTHLPESRNHSPTSTS